MAAAMKFDSQIIIQAKVIRAVPLLVANASSDGGVRGYAQWDDEKWRHMTTRCKCPFHIVGPVTSVHH